MYTVSEYSEYYLEKRFPLNLGEADAPGAWIVVGAGQVTSPVRGRQALRAPVALLLHYITLDYIISYDIRLDYIIL